MWLGDCLVNFFVLFNPAEKIAFSLFPGCIFVVRITRADFQCNIGSDDGRIAADGFQKYDNNPLLFCNTGFNFGP